MPCGSCQPLRWNSWINPQLRYYLQVLVYKSFCDRSGWQVGRLVVAAILMIWTKKGLDWYNHHHLVLCQCRVQVPTPSVVLRSYQAIFLWVIISPKSIMFNKRVLPSLLPFFVGLTFPPSAIVVWFRFLAYFGVLAPVWIVIVGALASVPVSLAVRGYWRQLRYRRTATGVGALVPPVLEGRWPGNVDILMIWLDNFNNRYPGNVIVLILSCQSLNMRISCLPMWSYGGTREHVYSALVLEECGVHCGAGKRQGKILYRPRLEWTYAFVYSRQSWRLIFLVLRRVLGCSRWRILNRLTDWIHAYKVQLLAGVCSLSLEVVSSILKVRIYFLRSEIEMCPDCLNQVKCGSGCYVCHRWSVDVINCNI